MIILDCDQYSDVYWAAKVAKIGGTRFSKVISNVKNRLIYELMNEILDNTCEIDDFTSEEIQYGIDNEDLAMQLYEKKTGIKTRKVGMLISHNSNIHIHSADGISLCKTIIQEVKCTMDGSIHLQRIHEGVDQKYKAQCINGFAIDDAIKEVHFISYCGDREEHPLHVEKLYRKDFEKEINLGKKRIKEIEEDLKEKLSKYYF